MPKDELSRSLSAVGDVINEQITTAVEAQGRDLTAKIEAQGRDLTEKIEAQSRDLTEEIGAQGRDLAEKIGAHAQRTENVERQLGNLDTNVSSLSRTFDRQQTVIWAVVALLGAAVVGLLGLVTVVALNLIQDGRREPIAAPVPAAIEQIESSQPTAELPDEAKSAESTIATP